MKQTMVTLLLFAVLATALGACKSYTLLSQADQQAIEKGHFDKRLYLKQSFFAGPFFAYDDRLLISERAFDERVLIQGVSGDPILPSKADHVLPMGTAMLIKRVEFPTSAAISDRKLKSPRHFVWVYLEKAEGDTPKPYVLVLTQEFRRVKQFDSALATFLVKKDPRGAFASRLPEVLEAIDNKKIVRGMRADALMRSRGYPDKISRKSISGARIENWTYASKREVVLKNDVVQSWKGFPDIPAPQSDAGAATPANPSSEGGTS